MPPQDHFEIPPGATLESGFEIPAGSTLESSLPQSTDQIRAVPPPSGIADSISRWAENVAADIKYGTDHTGIGTVLQKMGAHGVYNGAPEAVGDFMASLPLGLLKMTQGGGEVAQPDKRWQGTKDIVGGALQASQIPSAFIAPEAGEAAANAAGAVVDKVASALPSTARAGQLFESVASDANKIPVSLDNSGDAILKLMDWQKKTQLGVTINKFLNRVTNPNLGALDYQEARDYYKLLGDLSNKEKSQLSGPVKYDLTNMVIGLKQDIGNAAGQVGRSEDYYSAMSQYRRGSQFNALQDSLKSAAGKWAIGAAAGSGAGAGYYMLKALRGGK